MFSYPKNVPLVFLDSQMPSNGYLAHQGIKAQVSLTYTMKSMVPLLPGREPPVEGSTSGTSDFIGLVQMNSDS